jgi:hypothetical protein
MNPENYRQQSVDDADDAITVLLATIVFLGIGVFAFS